MKVCPKCGSTTTDDTQSFCLMDGIQLVAGESQPTVAMPSVTTQTTISPTPRKRRIGLWLILGVLFLLVGGAAIAAMLIYAYRLGSESTRNSQIDVNVSQPTRSTPTPRTAATITQSSPATVANNATTPVAASPSTEAGESTPITWTTSASTFKQDVGLTYTFDCPPEGTRGIVWGSDIYTADSSVCTAAVHAGKITVEKGGQVTIEFRPGRSTYGATTRNGVTSYNFGEYPKSFVFK